MTHREKLLSAKTLEEFIQIETFENRFIKTADDFYNYLRYSITTSSLNARWYSLYHNSCHIDLYVDISEYEIIDKLIELGFDRQVRFRGVYIIHKKDYDYSQLGISTKNLIENSFVSEQSDIVEFLENNNSPRFVVNAIIQTMLMGIGNVSGSCQDYYEKIIETLYTNQNLSKNSIEIIKSYSKFMSKNTIILSSLLIGEKIGINNHTVSYSVPIYIKGTYDKISKWFDDRIVIDYYCDFEGLEKIDSKEMFKKLLQNKMFTNSVFEDMIDFYNHSGGMEQLKDTIESFIDDESMVMLLNELNRLPEYEFVYTIIQSLFKESTIVKQNYQNTLAIITESPKDLV